MEFEGTERLGFLIHDAGRLMRRRFEKLGREYGLSSAQWRLLVRVVKDEGVAQARLAELLEVEPISVSRLLDRMEEGGWIERRQDAADRRVRMIFPSEKSREAFGAIRAVAGDVFEQALTGLSPSERQGVLRGLAKIIENLSDAEAPDHKQTLSKGATG
ncbi:MarR family winged helix-turn-helix transcriptional regulator [Mesorhizobium sp. KR2-14]|jgi:DNA-binding MarR family transcriptional regulator|uniref:MarR family winged helix-turn-helix transcriptional regulator n=1 Tax=Mesorhizobium sp. KR2-14 TaxID=3156610 RepID=UPI0032B41E2B